MTKENIFGFIILILLLSFFTFRNSKNKNNNKNEKTLQVENEGQSNVVNNDFKTQKTTFDIDVVRSNSNNNIEKKDDVFLENSEIKVYFSKMGGAPSKIVLKNYKNYKGEYVTILDNTNIMNVNLITSALDTYNLDFTVENLSNNKVDFKFTDSQNEILISYELDESKPFNVKQTIVSNADNQVNFSFNDILLQQEKYLKDCKSRSAINYLEDGKISTLTCSTPVKNIKKIDNCKWIAFKQKFFTTGLSFKDNVSGNIFARGGSNSSVSEFNTSVILKSNSRMFEINYFFGPNKYNILKSFDDQFEKNIYLGFTLVSIFNKYVILPLSEHIHNTLHVSVIIFILVILIKLLILPINFKVHIITKKMQLLNKLLTVLKRKYKDNPQRLTIEQIGLYKEFGVNPLFMLLYNLVQFPFIIAIYNFIPNEMFFRGNKFLWCDDMASVDGVLTLGFNIPFYGNIVGISSILMGVTMFLHMYFAAGLEDKNKKITPFHIFFTIFIVCISNRFCFALNFYYILFNICTFGIQLLFNKYIKITEFEDKVDTKLRQIM